MRDGSPITSTRHILPKASIPPMPNLIPIPLIGEAKATPSTLKAPPPYIEPTIRIVENPRENSLRFRYECEGRSAGSLQGVTSTASNKTFPSIEILNYRGPAVVLVSCVNATGPPLTHPHNLVGKDCKKGVCTININNDSMFCMFHNLGVQCVRRKDVDKSLTQRQSIRVDPFNLGFQHKNSPMKIDLNAVRLCFQVFIIGQKGTFTKKLEPVLSTPVYDAKAKKDLQIIEISDDNSSVNGGRKIVILCEKVAKEDIQVNFFEEDEEGNRTWEALADFRQSDVHKQYGICLKTPMYRNRSITSPVRAYIELRKTSNRTDTSDPLPFYFTPSNSSHAISPSPRSPFPQSQFSMVEVSNSISEEDLPTVLIDSHVATASEDDVTRAVYNTLPSTQRLPLHRQTTKMSRPYSTSRQDIGETLSVSPQKRVKL